MIAGIKFRGAWTLILLFAVTSGVCGQSTAPALRRILVVPPPQADPAVQKWIDTQREANVKKPQHGGLFTMFSNQKPAPASAKASPTKKKSGKQAPEPEVTDRQLSSLSNTLLFDRLSQRLRTRFHLNVPTEAEVKAGGASLHLADAGSASPEMLNRLAKALDCDAILIARVNEADQREGSARALTLHGTVQVLLPETSGQAPAPSTGRRRTRRMRSSVPPSVFHILGTASAGRVLFHNEYRRTMTQLAFDAAEHAAAAAAHSFWTGEISPFTVMGERLALLPVPAPAQADALLFTPEGRRVSSAAVRDLPTDMSTQFRPDITPFRGTAVVDAESVRRILAEEGMSAEGLWRQDQPDVLRVQALARRLGCTYVLMAHITEIELQTGVPDVAEAFSTREARAEAFGAMIRVADGAILWQDRATATMTLHPTADRKPASIDRQAVEDAEHFALSDLNRRFSAYRARFED